MRAVGPQIEPHVSDASGFERGRCSRNSSFSSYIGPSVLTCEWHVPRAVKKTGEADPVSRGRRSNVGLIWVAGLKPWVDVLGSLFCLMTAPKYGIKA